MSQNAYHHALEIVKIILQHSPQSILCEKQKGLCIEEDATNIAKFTRELADMLHGIEEDNLKR